MIFAYFVVVVFLLMAFFVFKTWGRSLFSLLMVFIYSIAISVVLFPDYTNVIAQSVGITRGVDLIVILYCICSLNIILLLGRKLYIAEQNLTDLARKLTLLEQRIKTK